jgi:hypothetical protein
MAKPGPHGKDRQRCGARVRHRHGFCRRWPVPGKERCRQHGGRSTGPLTDDGKARSLAAMREGRQRWLDDMRAKKVAGEIERFPGGRKSGARWVTPAMRAQREIEAIRRCHDDKDAGQPASLPPRRRGRPSNAEVWARIATPENIARAKARLAELRAEVREPPKPSPLERLLQAVAEAERQVNRSLQA